MKKIFGMILAVIVSITSVMLAFSWLKFDNKTASAAGILEEGFSEEKLKNKVDIIDPNTYYPQFSSQLKENQSPFDKIQEKMMPGYAIVPAENENKEVNSIYYINNITFNLDESVFMWIFIPSELTYNLKVTFETSSGGFISWEYTDGVLMQILRAYSSEDIYFGWRLFEFCVEDAEMSGDVKNALSTSKFTEFNISYTTELGDLLIKNNNKFSFYHVYKANSFSESSTIVLSQSYANYKMKEGVFNKIYFIDEEIYFTSVSDIFEYFYIGQINLLQYPNSNYTWKLTVTDSDGVAHDKNFGDKFVFEKNGGHRLDMILNEYRKNGSTAVALIPISFNIQIFTIGAFTNVDYKVDKGETKLITFKFSSQFTAIEDTIKVTVSDKNKASVTYYVENGICYIKLTGIKKGDIMISVESDGEKKGSFETKTYFVQTAVEITDENAKSSDEVFLLVITGISGVGFAIFVVISLVKSRYVSVK